MSTANEAPLFLLQEQLTALSEDSELSEGALVKLSATAKSVHDHIKSLICNLTLNEEKLNLNQRLVELSVKKDEIDNKRFSTLERTMNAMQEMIDDQKKIIALLKEKEKHTEQLRKDAARVLGLADEPRKRPRRK